MGEQSRGNHLPTPSLDERCGPGASAAQRRTSVEVSSGPVQGLGRRPVLQLAALGPSRSCPYLPLSVLSSGSWLPEEGRHALAKSAKHAQPQLCCGPPRSSGLSTAQLLGSSSEQSGLRRVPDRWFVPSDPSFLCRPLKCSKHQKAGSLSLRQGPERLGLTLEQEREMKTTQKFRF